MIRAWDVRVLRCRLWIEDCGLGRRTRYPGYYHETWVDVVAGGGGLIWAGKKFAGRLRYISIYSRIGVQTLQTAPAFSGPD